MTTPPAAGPSAGTLGADPLSAATAMGPVRLAVDDLDGLAAFYERAVGLRVLERGERLVRLGPPGGPAVVELASRPGAPPRPRRTTGLFHLAVLVPARSDLALAVRRVDAAGWGFDGASDHLVSEALYLHDPEGNGIEIYRDRPRHEWPVRDGRLQMATDPLDIEGVMAEMPGGADPGMPSGTAIGHVHLQVADLEGAEDVHGGVIGFEVTVRGHPGALFLAAGGYHHHIGLNTWGTAGAPAPPPGALGLDRFEVLLAGTGELDRVAGRAADAGLDPVAHDGGVLLADPSGNRVLVRGAPAR